MTGAGGVSRAAAIALVGIEGTPVMVEAAVTRQLPGMAIIGLPDAALAEAKLRVRTATAQASMSLTDRFLIINLRPATLPKHGSGFDLAIALAALAASGRLPSERLARVAHIGELGLDARLRRPLGLLSAVVAARRLGFDTVMVPEACSAEAALVSGVTVIAVQDLTGAVAWHRGEAGAWRLALPSPPRAGAASDRVEPPPLETSPSFPVARSRPGAPPAAASAAAGAAGAPELDIADVVGQPEAVEALIVAAAGRHHLSLLGPPGAGKTLLATRLPSLLPDLSPEESLTASSIASLGGAPLTALVRRPPFVSPHHTASKVAIIGGGGVKGITPGAVTRACHGVLFLDEAPEFPRSVLDALRQPLESGVVEIHRAGVHATLPSLAQIVLAANPCPCGNAGSPDTALLCRCSPSTRVRYLQRVSGPLQDRIDIRLTVRRVASVLLDEALPQRTTSAEARASIASARARAAERLAGTPWTTNGELPGHWLRSPRMRLRRAETVVLDQALNRGALTVRGYDRVLRLAWTIGDLEGAERPGRRHVARALALREGVAA